MIDPSEFSDGPPGRAAFDRTDIERLETTARQADRAARLGLGGLLPAGFTKDTTGLLANHCRFAHRAVLLFPASVDGGIRHLQDQGFDPAPKARSILVRRRLADRYRLDPADCDVWLTRCRPPESMSGTRPNATRTLELFLFPRSPPALQAGIIDGERAYGFEDHVALAVHQPHTDLLIDIATAFRTDADLVFEGGAYIPHEGPHGSTAMYFVGPADPASPSAGLQRWELHCPGDFTALLAELLTDVAVAAARRMYEDHVRVIRSAMRSRHQTPAAAPAVA